MAGEKTKVAADGGPASDFVSNPVCVPTVKVRMREGQDGEGNTYVIRRVDFDSGKHEEVRERVRLPEKAKETAPVFGTESEDDLLKMSIEHLKEKPEWKASEDFKTAAATKDKKQIVSAILAVRASAGTGASS